MWYRTPERGQTDKRGFKTKRDAEAFAATIEVLKMRGEYVAPTHARVLDAGAGICVAGAPEGTYEAVRLPFL